MGIQPIPVDYKGPLPAGCVGLVLGLPTMTLKGLVAHPGVVSQACDGELQVLCSCPRGVFSISPGDLVAQLLFLPSFSGTLKAPAHPTTPGVDSAYLMLSLHSRPSLDLNIEGKIFSGILDTGADKSIISSRWWPKAWPLTQSSHSLQGLGYEASPTISSRALRWEAPEGQEGKFVPYVLPLPVNLWGRDILQGLGLRLVNDYSLPAQQMMTKMGYKTGKGLGKCEQGMLEPIQPFPKSSKHGLGFS